MERGSIEGACGSGAGAGVVMPGVPVELRVKTLADLQNHVLLIARWSACLE